MVITAQGMILRLKVEDVSVMGRATQGVRLIQLDEGDEVVAVAKLAEKQDDEEEAK
jgi:DNA gyrase subunit A